jgi:hypothetical protein
MVVIDFVSISVKPEGFRAVAVTGQHPVTATCAPHLCRHQLVCGPPAHQRRSSRGVRQRLCRVRARGRGYAKRGIAYPSERNLGGERKRGVSGGLEDGSGRQQNGEAVTRF